YAPSGDRLRGEALRAAAHRLSQAARLYRADGNTRTTNGIRSALYEESRWAELGCHRRVRRAARNEGRISWRPAQHPGTDRPGCRDRRRGIPFENRNTRNGDSVRRSWRGDDATEREDGDVRIEGFRPNGYTCTEPFVKRDEPRCRGLWHVLHEHRRRQVHIQRRASAPAHSMEWTQRTHC